MNWKRSFTVLIPCLLLLPVEIRAQQPGGSSPPALVFQQGIVSTLVGNGTSGDTGDGGSSTAAEVTNGIRSIAADAAGDVFFVDDTNGTVRVVYEGGSTVAKLIQAENPSVSSPQVGSIYLLAGKEGGTGTPSNGVLATSALLKPGAGLSIDIAGDVYFQDTGTNKVWVIYAGGTGTSGTNLIALEAGVTSPQLGFIYAIAGNSVTSAYKGDGSLATSASVSFHGINDMKLDAAGNLYIVDQGNNAIRVVNATTGILTTFAGGANGAGTAGSTGNSGPATGALLNAPYGIAVDAAGDVYIADKSNHEIRVVYEGGTQAAELITLENKTVASSIVGDIYIVAGNGSTHYPYGVLATSSALNSPTMVALDGANNIYIAENGYALVLEVNALTGVMTDVAGNSTAGYSGDGGAAISAELNGLRCVAVDTAGRIYITDATNNRIREVSQGIVTFVGEPVGSTSAPQTVTITNAGASALNFTGGTPVFSGPNAGDFALDPSSSLNTCNLSSLQPGGTCNLAITYAPTNAGTSSAVLTYATNGVLPTQQLTLQGQLTPATTGLAASATAAYPGEPLMLTATVSSVGTPTGTVTFLQGTTALQTVPLPSSGTVSYSLGSLALGAYTYSVKYSGDTNYAGSTSNVVTIDVDTFAISAAQTTLSVVPGQAAQTTLTIAGQGPAAQSVTLSCAAPSILGCAFTPTTVSVPANGSTTVTISVGAVATTSSLEVRSNYAPALLPLAGLLGFGLRRRRGLASLVVVLSLGLLPLVTLCGCGENNIGKAVGPSTQTLVVTASGPGATPLAQNVTLTINLQ